MTIFETPRLILRQFTVDDAPLIYRLNNDPEILKYLHEKAPENEAQAREIIINVIMPQYQNRLGRWAMHTKEDYRFIGWCGLKYLENDGIIDLGYRVMKDLWGNGYATEAAIHTLRYGLSDLQIDTIRGIVHVDNKASIHVLEKAGMKFSREALLEDQPVKIYTISQADLPQFVKQN
jgi:[ribosomal protein S5]-alanine N-acetyltransferase